MITRGQLRPRGQYAGQLRGTTPQPRQRLRRLQHLQDGDNDVKVEEVNDLTGQEHFVNQANEYEMNEYHAEEAAREDDIEDKYDNMYHEKYN
eukprot:4137902-Amphidinium_carterae.1